MKGTTICGRSLIGSGQFSRGDREMFRPLVDSLLNHDPFLLLADFRAYIECQRRVRAAWLDQDRWTAMSILNVARAGYFSSDRSIREYCEKVWNVPGRPKGKGPARGVCRGRAIIQIHA